MTTSNQKNIPALRFKEFDGFYLLSKLSSILDRYSEKNKDEEFSINDILSLSVRCGIVSRKKLLEDRYEKVNHLNYIKTRVGDFVYGKSISASCPYGVFKANNYTDGLLSTLYYTFKVRKNIIPTYLDYYFSHLNRADNFLKKYVLVGARYITADVNYILSGEIFIPSKKEQQKVARFLTAIDQKINQLSRKVALQERYKKGVTQKLFSQELRFKDADGRDFADWEVKKLGDVCNIQKGKQLNRAELTDIGAYPTISGGINPSGYTDKWNELEDSIIISEGGNSCGYVNFIRTKFWCGGHCYILKGINENIDNIYLYHYLKHTESKIMSLRVGSCLPNIQKKDIKNHKIYFPIFPEQQKIAHFLSQLDEQIQQTRQQLAHLQDYKKGLLQQLFV